MIVGVLVLLRLENFKGPISYNKDTPSPETLHYEISVNHLLGFLYFQ